MASDGRRDDRSTDSGIEIKAVYTAADLKGWEPEERLGDPGKRPYAGIYPNMYRGRPWTMRQYSGFGTAEATNERWKLLLANGSKRLVDAARNDHDPAWVSNRNRSRLGAASAPPVNSQGCCDHDKGGQCHGT